MVSLLLDEVVCAVLLGAGYLLFFNGKPAATKAAKSKKKKSKAKGNKQETPAGDNAVKAASAAPAGQTQKPEKRAAAPAPPKVDIPAKQPSQKANTKLSNGKHSPNNEYPPLSAAAPPATASKSTNGNSNSNASQPRPLAERLGKKQRKTVVDDMLESDDELRAPTYKQTMRIVKPKPDAPLIVDQQEEGDEQEASSPTSDGWEKAPKADSWQTVAQKSGSAVHIGNRDDLIVVDAHAEPATIRIGSSTPTSGTNSPAAYAPPRSIPGMTEPTKKQRQNANRAAAEKAAKDAAEQDRLQRLAAHKRALERERMNAQAKEREKEKGKQQKLTNRQNLSGGMQAKVENGALIWE